MTEIVAITTFANQHFDLYAKRMLETFVANWPKEIPLLINLDDDKLLTQVQSIIRPGIDSVVVGWSQEHIAFVERNKNKDDGMNYRKQVTRFCHKVFAIKQVLDAARTSPQSPRYLVWLDADVHTAGTVTMEDIKLALPKDGDAVSYLGRKDWPHSECGWLAFDLTKGGDEVIDVWHGLYTSDQILKLEEQHDSWAFDHIRESKDAPPMTNLTADKPGMDIWQHSPMAKWSIHYKGPVAKAELGGQVRNPNSNIQILTKNSIPDEEIQSHIAENQKLIKNWVEECNLTDEEIIIVSAGPTLIAEDVPQDGRKIVAVKHALGRLKDAGIKPWACILLDPRPHVADFVKEPDKDVLWFVASQVDPKVTLSLLAHGCEVWGYHAAVGAREEFLTKEQPRAIIHGGSATATRGLFMLRHLGFWKMELHGYDLSFPDKPDLKAVDDKGQPKYLEMSAHIRYPMFELKKCFWTEPQLLAQYEEFQQILNSGLFQFKAHGIGVIPQIVNGLRVSNLRQGRLRSKIKVRDSYESLLCSKTRKIKFLTPLRRISRLSRRKTN